MLDLTLLPMALDGVFKLAPPARMHGLRTMDHDARVRQAVSFPVLP